MLGSARLLRGSKSYPVSDAIVTTGTPIGDKQMNGSFRAGFDHAALIELRVRIAAAATQTTSAAVWIFAIAALISLIALMLYAKTRAAILRAARAFWSAATGAEVWKQVIAGLLILVIAGSVVGLVKLLT